MNRRFFLKRNVTGLLTAGFIANWGTMEQIRNYMNEEKPLLTENNLNRFFARSARNKELKNHTDEAVENLGNFLDHYFSPSPAQRKMIESFIEEDRQRLNRLLRQSSEENKIPQFKFGNRGEQCQKTSVTLPSEKGIITVTI